MKNNQIVRQPSQTQAPTSELKQRDSGQIRGWNFLIHLLTNYSWLLLIGLLAVFVVSAALSVYSLVYLEDVKPEEPDLQAEVVPSTNKPADVPNPTPLWVIGAIILGCSSGCFVLFRLFNRPSQAVKSQKQLSTLNVGSVHNRQRLEPPLSKKPPAFVPSSVRVVTKKKSGNTKPIVTVLPPEQHEQDSLAEMLDIRKQTPLSAILRN